MSAFFRAFLVIPRIININDCDPNEDSFYLQIAQLEFEPSEHAFAESKTARLYQRPSTLGRNLGPSRQYLICLWCGQHSPWLDNSVARWFLSCDERSGSLCMKSRFRLNLKQKSANFGCFWTFAYFRPGISLIIEGDDDLGDGHDSSNVCDVVYARPHSAVRECGN